MTFRANIFSLETIYTIVLFIAILLVLGNKSGKKNDKLRLIEKSGVIYEIGTNTPFTGAIKDTVFDKILEYYLIDGKKYGDFKVTNLNGIVEINGVMSDNKNEGVWNYFYPSGQLESRGTFYNDKLNGVWKWYFPNGNIKAIGYYEDDKKIGTWKFFDAQSKIIREISYKDDNVELVRMYDFNSSL